jgi:hypothetical protein
MRKESSNDLHRINRIFINKLGVAPHPQTPGPRRKQLPPYLLRAPSSRWVVNFLLKKCFYLN